MNVDFISIAALVLALFSAGYATWRLGTRGNVLTREQVLEKEVHRLQAAVETLISDRTAAQKRIDTLERELAEAKERIRMLEGGHPMQTQRNPRPTLLVAVGDDPMLRDDLLTLRKVAARKGFRVERVTPLTRDELTRQLDRNRKAQHPVRYLHFAVHAGPGGLQFAGGDIVPGEWLAEKLSGIKVAVIAGCDSDQVGDMLPLPAIVSMREDISNEDATRFTEAFWSYIGDGMDPERAFEATILEMPIIGEFAEFHG